MGILPSNSIGIKLLTGLLAGCSKSSEYVTRDWLTSAVVRLSVKEREDNELTMPKNWARQMSLGRSEFWPKVNLERVYWKTKRGGKHLLISPMSIQVNDLEGTSR